MTDGFPLNAALIQDELLGELALASRGEKPGSPATVQALSSLVEAAVLHEVLYYRPFETDAPPAGFHLASLIDDEPLVRELVRADILRVLPADDVKAVIEKSRAEDTWEQFLADFFWQPHNFLTLDITEQRDHYKSLGWLLKESQAIFEQKELTAWESVRQRVPIVETAATLVSRGCR